MKEPLLLRRSDRLVLTRANRHRGGWLYFELVISIAILMALIGFTAKGLISLQRQTRVSQHVEARSVAAENLMETFAALPFDELSTANLQQLASAQPIPANCQWTVRVELQDDFIEDVESKKIWLALNAIKQHKTTPPVRLVTWRHAPRSQP